LGFLFLFFSFFLLGQKGRRDERKNKHHPENENIQNLVPKQKPKLSW